MGHWSSLGAAPAAPTLPLKSGDVIALTGGANMERTRFHGHLQTLLVTAHPQLNLRVRNFGWEGDTVFEQWRDDSKEQWRRSRDWRAELAEAGATVVIAQFGQMEALGGPERLDEFIAAYDRLLADFGADGRRVVVLPPVPFERGPLPHQPDLTRRNGEVRRYAEAIRDLAKRRGCTFVDLFTPLARRPAREGPLTDNGFHLNEHGHRAVAELVAQQLGLKPAPGAPIEAVRAAVLEVERLWFDTWRPMNWSFLAGDRTHVPFSRDWRDQEVRLFPEEMREFAPLLRQADENVRRALAGRPVVLLAPRSPIPEYPPSTASQTPEQQLATLKVDPRFEVNLFASEADGIVKPIQMRWDERGRLWVACTVSYPQIKPGERANDYIMVCEDTDGDGRADRFTRFVEGLFMPTGVELGDGGLYVAQGTELLHFRDTNGDGRADQRRIVLGGFGTADSHQMINGLNWGFGGELWFTQGHHIYSRVETPHGVERLNRAGVWRFRPRTLRLDAFFQMSSAGANTWGVVTDDFGQPFHKSGATIGGFYSTPGLIRSDLALDSEAMHLFQARSKQVGMEIIGSRHFPEDMQGLFVIGGYYDSQLQLYRLDERDGVFSTRQLPPIIETTNNVFRPIEVRPGPDGAIYFADWYNPIIGHYQASYRHPDRDKSHGRIWRVSFKGRPLVKPPRLAGASVDELFNLLDSPERWVKYQAKRLLFEKDSAEVASALDRRVKSLKPGDVRDEYLRLQALSLYEAHEAVRPKLLASLLRSPDFRVRAYATRALGQWSERVPGGLKLLEAQTTDEHPRVRLEAVVAASYFAEPRAVAIATRVLDRPMDGYLVHALTKAVDALRPHWQPALRGGTLTFERDEHLLFVLQKGGLPDAAALIRDGMERRAPPRHDGRPATDRSEAVPGAPNARLRPWLVALAAVGGPEDLRFVFDRGRGDLAVLDALAETAEARKVMPAGDVKADLEALLIQPDDALRTRAVRLTGLWRGGALSGRIRSIAEDRAAPEAVRIEALKSFARLRGKESLPVLTETIAQSASTPGLALGALEAVARVSLREAAQLTVQRLASAASVADASRWMRPVLQAAGGYGALTAALPDGALASEQARFALSALSHAGRYQKALVERLSQLAGFSADVPVYSPEFVRELGDEALRTGNARAGRKVYEMLGCAACHVINGEGAPIGPELTTLARGLPLDGIITELIWPQLNVKEGFEAASLTTRDGRIIEGMKQAGTGDEIAVRDTLTGEVTRVPRSQIERLRSGGSVMPEGLTAPLTRQQLADLVRYLAELGK